MANYITEDDREKVLQVGGLNPHVHQEIVFHISKTEAQLKMANL